MPVPIREENGFAFSAEETLSLITPQTRLLIINSPANPTGGVTPRAEIEKLVAGLARHPGVALLSDEIYDQMVYEGGEHVTLLGFPSIADRTILLNGLSKTYAMTGWRLGYSVWPDALYDKVRKLAVNSWSCVNAPAQFAALEALTGPQEAVHKMVAAFDKRRKVIVERLNSLPGFSCATPRGAFYAFPNVKDLGIPAKKFAAQLLDDAGVALIGGALLGSLVGTVIVAQTLYSSTKDHLGEFATLRALGSSSGYIHQVILAQAGISAVVGYALGISIALTILVLSRNTALPMVMTPGLAFWLFTLTVGMCAISALSAIVKVTKIDPATVFNR